MVRIAVGYTGHAPPKSDDTDANSKRHTNTPLTVCACAHSHFVRKALGDGSKYIKAFWPDDVMWELRSYSHLL